MYWRVSALAVVVVTWSTLMTSSSGSREQAKRLYDEKLEKSRYNNLIRPVGNASQSLTVFIGLRLTSIIDVVSRLNLKSRQLQDDPENEATFDC